MFFYAARTAMPRRLRPIRCLLPHRVLSLALTIRHAALFQCLRQSDQPECFQREVPGGAGKALGLPAALLACGS